MTAATLFSGIGAPELAMPSWDWLWHAEIEKFPTAVMAARFPHSVNLGDVTADDFCERALAIGRPDVLVFGSPCQSYSVAGKRLGLDDPRGNLALVALGIIARIEPTWFLFENVPGLLSSSEGRDFGLFLRAVDECGYSLAWSVLDAQYAGLAQRRKRVFAVGSAGDWRGPAAILLEPESLCGNLAPSRETRQDVTGTLGSRSAAGGGLGTDFDLSGGVVAFGGNNHSGPIDVATARSSSSSPHGRLDFKSETFLIQAGALRENPNSGPNGVGVQENLAYTLEARSEVQAVAHTLRGEGMDASEDGAGRGTPLVSVAVGWTGDTTPKFGVEISPTLRAEQGGEGVGVGARRLTPIECERLQGMPDHHTLITYRGKPAADGPRYKAIGNSMAVPCVRWILTRLEFVHLAMHGEKATKPNAEVA